MKPVAALRRAIHLLGREPDSGQKVKAFRRAIETVMEVGEKEIALRAEAGTLTELEGIGKSTAEVIIDALDHDHDGYLARLDHRSQVPVGIGSDLLASIRGDCHVHSTWSDGGAPLIDMARTAIDIGHEWMVCTDHSARLTIANGLDDARLLDQLDEIEQLNDELAPFRLLTGMEVDIFEDGTLDLSEEMLDRLDVVVASIHSKLYLPPEDMTRRMVRAIASPHIDVLGHCTNRKLTGRGRPQSEFDPTTVFAACAQFDTAVEINCRPERRDPPDQLLELAVEQGCKVAINTDAHATGQMEWLPHGADKAARCAVPVGQIVNTWTADELLAWTASRDS